VVVAVAVVLAIGLVVLVVVADEIVQREAVVGGDEVDAGVGLATATAVQIAAAREAIGQGAQRLLWVKLFSPGAGAKRFQEALVV